MKEDRELPFALLRDELALRLCGGWSYARVAGLLGFSNPKKSGD
tara:strand:+ start:95 stop:226 length:132 start_codon:yes stop_codon:yes gene_type:complete